MTRAPPCGHINKCRIPEAKGEDQEKKIPPEKAITASLMNLVRGLEVGRQIQKGRETCYP